MRWIVMGNCQICGEPSGYFPICRSCNELKDKGEVKKCDDCGKWMKSNKPLCKDCWSKSVGKQPATIPTTSIQTGTHISVDNSNSSSQGQKIELYTKMLIQAWDDGVLTKAEKDLLRTLRNTLGISEETHEKIEQEVMNANKTLIEAIKESEKTANALENDFRNKWPPKLRTEDGHVVRSKGERDIDNWLYSKEIVHIYEKNEINTDRQEVYCDFYLPYDKDGEFLGNRKGGIYIEYWGLAEKAEYAERMKQKQEFYNKKGLILVEIVEAEMNDPTTVLPKKFIKYFGDKVT
jgi:hypothetical protein